MAFGMEMMLSNMIGMKPDELERAAKQTIGAITDAAKRLEMIEARLANIEGMLNRKELTNGHGHPIGGSECTERTGAN